MVIFDPFKALTSNNPTPLNDAKDKYISRFTVCSDISKSILLAHKKINKFEVTTNSTFSIESDPIKINEQDEKINNLDSFYSMSGNENTLNENDLEMLKKLHEEKIKLWLRRLGF